MMGLQNKHYFKEAGEKQQRAVHMTLSTTALFPGELMTFLESPLQQVELEGVQSGRLPGAS